MPAAMPSLAHTALAIPDARQCLLLAAPFLGLAAFYWLFWHSDRLIEWLFPHWEWERKLGWLNFRANRIAETVLRWIGHAVHALLCLALYGILWGSSAFDDIAQEAPNAVADGMGKLMTLLICLGIWSIYLGSELIPRLKNQYEREELEKFREEHPELNEEHERPRKSHSPLDPSKIEIWSKVPPRLQKPGKTRRY